MSHSIPMIGGRANLSTSTAANNEQFCQRPKQQMTPINSNMGRVHDIFHICAADFRATVANMLMLHHHHRHHPPYKNGTANSLNCDIRFSMRAHFSLSHTPAARTLGVQTCDNIAVLLSHCHWWFRAARVSRFENIKSFLLDLGDVLTSTNSRPFSLDQILKC